MDHWTPHDGGGPTVPRTAAWRPGRLLTVTAVREEIHVSGDAPPAAPWDGVDGEEILYLPLDRGDGRLRPARALPARAAAARRAIPRRYLRPHLFRCSRAEALYDMHAPSGTLVPGTASWPWRAWAATLRLCRRVVTRLLSGGRLKRWRYLLAGRDVEQQLWEVTPPRGFPHLRAVRRWAAQALENAGYQPGPMLVEWEIFWRCRGCS